jgi:hypothetical protein
MASLVDTATTLNHGVPSRSPINPKILENPLCLHCVCKAAARPRGCHGEFDYRRSDRCRPLRRGAVGFAILFPARYLTRGKRPRHDAEKPAGESGHGGL